MTLSLSLQANSPVSGSNTLQSGRLLIGWATADITPDEPVVLTGSSSARISDGVLDPISATALALESAPVRGASDMVILVAVDLVSISDGLNGRVKEMVRQVLPEINTDKIILNATHTHAAPEHRTAANLAKMHEKHDIRVPEGWARWGADLGAMSPGDYVEFAARRISDAIRQAWEGRKPGGISFGIAHAAVGHNRITAYYDGSSRMGGSGDNPEFSHVEGYEDHTLNLIYTWDAERNLTGVMINVAIPSQVTFGRKISADYWHDTRLELRRRLGDDLFILPQCSAAGDQGPHPRIYSRAERRMEELTGRSRREQIAVRIADAVTSILPYMERNIEWQPVLLHHTEHLELPRRLLTEECIKVPRGTHHTPQVETVEERYERLMGEYKKMLGELENIEDSGEQINLGLRISGIHWRLARAWRTLERYELQKTQPTIPVEVHVIRIGDMAIATNPFELYLDYGMQIKARSKAVQTFIVQLATPSSGYVPTQRSVAGGAYGAIPESTQVGPEGGRELVEQILGIIESLWNR